MTNTNDNDNMYTLTVDLSGNTPAVEAFQLPNDPHGAAAIAEWCDGMAVASPGRVSLHFDTDDGSDVAHPGDWIIKSSAGNFSRSPEDTFEMFYESVGESN